MSGSPQITTDPKALAKLGDLAKACRTLERAERARDDAGAARNALFAELRSMGVTQRQIAETAQVSEPAVAKGIRKHLAGDDE